MDISDNVVAAMHCRRHKSTGNHHSRGVCWNTFNQRRLGVTGNSLVCVIWDHIVWHSLSMTFEMTFFSKSSLYVMKSIAVPEPLSHQVNLRWRHAFGAGNSVESVDQYSSTLMFPSEATEIFQLQHERIFARRRVRTSNDPRRSIRWKFSRGCAHWTAVNSVHWIQKS